MRRFRHSHPLGLTSINAAGQEAPDISDIPDSSQKGTKHTKCCDPVLRRFTANWRDSRNATPYFAAVAACVQVAVVTACVQLAVVKLLPLSESTIHQATGMWGHGRSI